MRASLGEIEAIYRSSGAGYFRLAVARLGNAQLAHDAVQEGFAGAIRGRASYRGSGSVEAWIARCVINAAHDLARSTAPDQQLDLDALPVGSFYSEPHDLLADVRQAVARLPQRQRDVLFLRHYLDFDYATIADALDVEVGTVAATLHAARAALAEDLEEVTR